jgi:hypothetical protein
MSYYFPHIILLLANKKESVSMYEACCSCLNRRVEAVISSKKLKISKKLKTSAFGFGFGGRERILTLALFDLLAFSLFI